MSQLSDDCMIDATNERMNVWLLDYQGVRQCEIKSQHGEKIVLLFNGTPEIAAKKDCYQSESAAWRARATDRTQGALRLLQEANEANAAAEKAEKSL